MASRIEARFFNTKRSKSGDIMCFLRGQQVGSVLRDGKRFWAFALKGDSSSDMFDTFAEAERWLWLHGV